MAQHQDNNGSCGNKKRKGAFQSSQKVPHAPILPDAFESVADRLSAMHESVGKGTSSPDPAYIENVQDQGFCAKWRYKTAAYILEYSELGLNRETLSLAISLFDRYLSKRSIGKADVELVAVVSIFMASKLIETEDQSFRVDEVVGAVKGATERMVVDLELDMLKVLDWNLNSVTCVEAMLYLAELFNDRVGREKKTRMLHFAGAFLDYAMCSYEFLKFSPFVQACAAILCACHHEQVDTALWKQRVNACGVPLGEHMMGVVKQCATALLKAFYKLFPALGASRAHQQEHRSTSPTNVQDIFAPCSSIFRSPTVAAEGIEASQVGLKKARGSAPIAIAPRGQAMATDEQYAMSPPEISGGAVPYLAY